MVSEELSGLMRRGGCEKRYGDEYGEGSLGGQPTGGKWRAATKLDW